MAYGDIKDLSRRAGSATILHDKAFNISENAKHDRYHSGFALIINTIFDENL